LGGGGLSTKRTAEHRNRKLAQKISLKQWGIEPEHEVGMVHLTRLRENVRQRNLKATGSHWMTTAKMHQGKDKSIGDIKKTYNSEVGRTSESKWVVDKGLMHYRNSKMVQKPTKVLMNKRGRSSQGSQGRKEGHTIEKSKGQGERWSNN